MHVTQSHSDDWRAKTGSSTTPLEETRRPFRSQKLGLAKSFCGDFVEGGTLQLQ